MGKKLEGSHDAMVDIDATVQVMTAVSKVAIDRQLVEAPMTIDDLIELSLYSQPPDAVDPRGQFRRRDGQIIFAFGKHKGRKISEVPVSYLKWMLTENFPVQIHEEIEKYLYD